MAETPKFITVEGGEGVGKSTQLQCIETCLRDRDIPLVVTREPGGTPLGERLRGLLLQREGLAPTPLAELLMVFAARAQHVATVIQPALDRGEWVLCDRFTDASYAYQGAGRGLSEATIAGLEAMTHAELVPDLTFLLDVDPDIGLDRARKRGDLDRFEEEEIDFFRAVRRGYHDLAKRAPQRWRIVDAAAEQIDVERQVITILDEWLAHECA